MDNVTLDWGPKYDSSNVKAKKISSESILINVYKRKRRKDKYKYLIPDGHRVEIP